MQRNRGGDADMSWSRLLLGARDEFEAPSWERVRERGWNPDDRRLLTPRDSVWGYDLNVYELLSRLGFIERDGRSD